MSCATEEREVETSSENQNAFPYNNSDIVSVSGIKYFRFYRTHQTHHVSCTLFNIENETDCLETVELMLIIPVVRSQSDG